MRTFCPVFLFLIVIPFIAVSRIGASPADETAVAARSGHHLRPFAGGETRLGAEERGRKLARTGIIEMIPRGLRERYERWKAELLATEFGRDRWERYASRSDFRLTIVVSPERKFGAGTDGFEWDGDGRLTGAVITIGGELEKGFPDPVYYPVMNSLSASNGARQIDGVILASAKLMHELAHVDFTERSDGRTYEHQNRLMNTYNKILLKNGYNTRDPRLVAISNELGGDPVRIWEDREYWSEVGAMRFLIERIGGEPFSCSVLTRMRRNIVNYASGYQDRFLLYADQAVPQACRG
jgi:hypothetical protein